MGGASALSLRPRDTSAHRHVRTAEPRCHPFCMSDQGAHSVCLFADSVSTIAGSVHLYRPRSGMTGRLAPSTRQTGDMDEWDTDRFAFSAGCLVKLIVVAVVVVAVYLVLGYALCESGTCG